MAKSMWTCEEHGHVVKLFLHSEAAVWSVRADTDVGGQGVVVSQSDAQNVDMKSETRRVVLQLRGQMKGRNEQGCGL